MDARVGDRIVIESERVGQADRTGVIVEVLPTRTGTPHYLVRWDDGHETDIRPAAGSARIVPAGEPVEA
jgi:hypothetical protein